MRENKFKLKYELKQHTPLVHFQYEQMGACLRATEVKPKLDRFLVKYAFKDKDKEKEDELAKCIQKKQDEQISLKYKMRIYSDTAPAIRIENGKMFLGNIGVKNPNKMYKSIFYNTYITLEIICFNIYLFEKIKEWISIFFTVTNFGMRQTKGYGSFTISNEKLAVENLKQKISQIYPKYCVIEHTQQNYYLIMKDISIIYALMKSGINYTKRSSDYYRGYVFQYMNNKNIGNDKMFIKQKIFKAKLKNNLREQEYIPKFVRAMLGVPGFYKYSDDDRKGIISVNSNTISRFSSPVVFKIIYNYIFILPNNIPKEMYGHEFKFNLEEYEKGDTSEEDRLELKNNGIKIYTPTQKEFELEDFLSSFSDYFNNRMAIPKHYDIKTAKKLRIEVVDKCNDISDSQ